MKILTTYKQIFPLRICGFAFTAWLCMGLSFCSRKRKGDNDRKIAQPVSPEVNTKNAKIDQPLPPAVPTTAAQATYASAYNPYPRSTVIDGFSGIPNLGNTCFMNSALQVIAAIHKDGLKGSLKELVDQINSGNPVTHSDVEKFRKTLQGAAATMACSGEQEDSQEFIELLQCDPKLNIQLNWIKRGISPQESIELQNLIDEAGDDLDSFGAISNKLVVFLERNRDKQKVDTLIHNTDEITHKKNTYVLQAFIEHSGNGLNSGHYVAYVKRNGQWYHTSDQFLKQAQDQTALNNSQKAYLLFYEKK